MISKDKSVYVSGVQSESGTINGPLSLQQSKNIKALLKRSFPSAQITFNKGHYYCSAFVRIDSVVVYLMTSDYRGTNKDTASLSFIVRLAKDEKDYTGGVNNWGRGFENIPKMISKFFQREI